MKIMIIAILPIFFFLLIHEADAQEKSKESLIKTVTKEEKALSRNEVEAITRKIVDENFKPLAEEKLKMANTTITYSSIIVGVVIVAFTIIFGFLAYLGRQSLLKAGKEIEGIRKVRETMEKELKIMKKRLKKENKNLKELMNGLIKAEETHNELKETSNEIRSRFAIHTGYAYWEISRALTLSQKGPLLPEQKEQKDILLREAINFTETALEAPPNKETQRMKNRLSSVQGKINLAYYYAELDEKMRKQYKEKALEYTEYVKEQITALRETDEAIDISGWLADYVFVKVRFATSREEINKAIHCIEKIAPNYPELETKFNKLLNEANLKQKEYIQREPFRPALDLERKA